jgi:hypothetical protein
LRNAILVVLQRRQGTYSHRRDESGVGLSFDFLEIAELYRKIKT